MTGRSGTQRARPVPGFGPPAPYVHIAIRGTVARAELRRVLAATYHRVWWPDASTVKYDGGEVPIWDECVGGYLDQATGEVLLTWDQALDAIGPEDEPWHVARFGERFDAQGVLTGSKEAARCIGYLTETDPARYAWEPVAPGDPDHMEHARRLLHAVADRARWQAALAEARRRTEDEAIPRRLGRLLYGEPAR
jgi:hypothetical protein